MIQPLPDAVAALLPLLEREAPRYTSYPSAHHFGPLGPGAHSAGLLALPPGERVGLYIHVPFCEELCWFCGCHTKATLRPEPLPRLQRQLLALQQQFLQPGGWYECRDSAGNVSREDMPSTTPYHLATCYSGLAKYFG